MTSHLLAAREAALTRAIVEGYTRLPPATPDQWGDLESLQDVSVDELMHRLGADENTS